MQRYLVQVSAKFDDSGDFKTVLEPTFVDDNGLQDLFKRYRLNDEGMNLDHGIDTFYSTERVYPFNRLLIMGGKKNFDLPTSIDKLLVSYCALVRQRPPQMVGAHDHSVK
jgi:hypothetical protein